MSFTESASQENGLLARWARTVARHPWRVLIASFAFVIVFGGIAVTNRGDFSDNFSIPGVESQQAFDLLRERFPAQSGDVAMLVFQHPEGVAAAQAEIEALLTEASTLPHVVAVVSPFAGLGQINADGTIAYATVAYDVSAEQIPKAEIERLVEMADAADGQNGLRVEAGGIVVAQGEQEEPGSSEIYGLAAAAVILLIAFGSVVAMGLPLVTAVVGLALGFMGVVLVARFEDIATFTPAFASMVGLGVGIDYALFIVTRYREGLADGLEPREAVARSVDTAGRAVIFAGGVVVISMLGLGAIGIPFITAAGSAAAIVVAAAILVGITILPAMLALIGRRIDRWSIHRTNAGTNEQGAPMGRRLSLRISKRPWLYAIAATSVLLVCSIPLLDLKLGFPGQGSNPPSYHSRQAYDLLSEGFGPGFNSTLLIAIEQPGGVNSAMLDQLGSAAAQVPGVVRVAPANVNEAGDTAVIALIPAGDINDDVTKGVVETLRAETIPSVLGGTGATGYVGGATAVFVDLTDRMVSRTPFVFIVVIGLSFLLLTIVFRSPVIALKAAIMNVLSIAAAFGVTIAVFQWGWGLQLLGIEEPQPIIAFAPMFLFTILFGLSMDYEVFLLSRIREAYVHGRTTTEAVAEGLTVTARVITAAAAIMICVFVSFMLMPDQITRQFGFGLAVAILIDATIVRLVLVPATMELLGEWNWWLPKGLDRLLPHLNIEGTTRPAKAELEPMPAD